MRTPHTRATIGLCAMAVLFFANHAKAQTGGANKLSFSAGGELGVVTGFEQSYRSVDIGAIVQLQYRVTNSIAFTFATGYDDLLSKTYGALDVNDFQGPDTYAAPSGSLGLVPLKAGIRVFTGRHFYISAGAGTWIYINGADYFESYPGVPAYSGQVSRLLLTGGFGWISKNTDIGFRFDNFSTSLPGYSGTMYYGIAAFHVAYIIR